MLAKDNKTWNNRLGLFKKSKSLSKWGGEWFQISLKRHDNQSNVSSRLNLRLIKSAVKKSFGGQLGKFKDGLDDKRYEGIVVESNVLNNIAVM